MTNLSRKIKRQKKTDAEKELKKKIGLFNKLPDHCLVCEKDFDKKNKDMVMTWSVVVKKEKEIVRLYCPECWTAAQQMVKEIENGSTDSENNV